MVCYLVGGAVRDAMLGLPIKERDWVVVGATPAAMLAQGFRQVGKDFPVFLHPITQEQYALARTERKTAPGYHGFSIDAAPTVTLEDDLQRRDLTINAMARDETGYLIDPYGGARDLRERWLRHVAPAFAEDPVRILRVARFAARYARFGFRIAPETLALVRTMVMNGEVDALVAERVWAETEKALAEDCPGRFLDVLRECGALRHVYPEVDRLFGVPQPPRHHPEIDTGAHLLLALAQAARLSADKLVRFAVLVHDVGKATTAPVEWPRHPGHEARGAELVRSLCQRLRIPKDYRDLGVLAAAYHTDCHRVLELDAERMFELLEKLDALRRPRRFEQFLLVCEADARGRSGFTDTPYSQAQRLRDAQQAALAADIGAVVAQGLQGQELAQAIRQARIQALTVGMVPARALKAIGDTIGDGEAGKAAP
ncbi:MAG: multifunctional CCA addition/repair protein [Gammaproteobacteria bacterium]